MATSTNYLNDLASMRQFIRSLTFGNHNRGKANVRGIKGSQHDDIIRRLDYFDIMRHIYTQRIGKASIHHLEKNDFIDGYNYLNNLYELYAAVPEQIYVQLCILAGLTESEELTLTTLTNNLGLSDYGNLYEELLKILHKQRNKQPQKEKVMDQQYIKRQVKTLETLGVIEKKERSKGYLYSIKNTILDSLTKQQLEELAMAVFFYTNVSLTSAAGHILLQKIMYLITGLSLKQQQESIMYGFNNTYFTFKDNNPNNVIDGDIFYPLADALHRHKKVRLTFYEPGKPKEVVTPLAVETYYGENKNILHSINNGHLQINRIDRIKSLEVTKYNSSDFIQTPVPLKSNYNSCILHFLTLPGYEPLYNQFIRQFKSLINILDTTSEYIELQLTATDILQWLPLLRSYLPYIHIISSDKPSINQRFYNNLCASLEKEFKEPEGYKIKQKENPFLIPKENSGTKKGLQKQASKRDTDINGVYVSSVLNDINAITFTTQYQIQLDLINGVSYTKQDIEELINHRRLLTTEIYKKSLPNDKYELDLANILIKPSDDSKHVESILSDLPLIIMSDAERMFLKDLINDDRANWLLSPELCQQIDNELKNINTTFPDGTWRKVPTMTDDTPVSMDTIKQCLVAIHQNARIILNDSEVSPSRLEYSVGSNGYTLIAYDHVSQTFLNISLQDIANISILDIPRLEDLETIYTTYRNESKQTLIFKLHDLNNAVDRCFNYFSNYTIQTKDIAAKEFTIEVNYLPFQEEDILRNLLKLGCAVRIVNESPLREKLKTIYKTALSHSPINESNT